MPTEYVFVSFCGLAKHTVKLNEAFVTVKLFFEFHKW